MARRTDNIHKRKDGRWEGRYKIGNSNDGKTKYRSVYGKTYTEVKNKMYDISIASTFMPTQRRDLKFSELLSLWFNANSVKHKGSTENKYLWTMEKHIIPELGNLKLSQINSSIINGFLKRKLVSGRLDHKGGLSASTVKGILIIIDIDTPEFSITSPNYTDNNSLKWHKTDVVISATDWTVVEGTNAVNATGWAESITKTDEKVYDFNVSFKDAYGNITNLVSIDKFAIDKTSPTDKNKVNVEFKDKYDSTIAKVINFLSFGLFCNEAVEVKVTADDEARTDGSPNSGIQNIQLFKYPVSGGSEEVELDAGKTDTFTIGLGFEGTLKVLITDNVGNTLGEQLITSDNSDMTDVNGYVMLEEIAPSVSELVDTPQHIPAAVAAEVLFN